MRRQWKQQQRRQTAVRDRDRGSDRAATIAELQRLMAIRPPRDLPALTGEHARTLAAALRSAADTAEQAAGELDATRDAARDASNERRVTALDALYTARQVAMAACQPVGAIIQAWAAANAAAARAAQGQG